MEKIKKFLDKLVCDYKKEIIISLVFSVLFLAILRYFWKYEMINFSFLENFYFQIFFSSLSVLFIIFIIYISWIFRYLNIFQKSKYRILKIIFLLILAFSSYFLFGYIRDFFGNATILFINFLKIFFLIFISTFIFTIFLILAKKYFPKIKENFKNTWKK